MNASPRLPPRPALTWRDDAPFAEDVGDIYFSGDGLAEARAVFLAGCGLPERWAGRELFVIGELGFGSGLNLLAAWHLWRRHRPSPTARLVLVSVEGAPMAAADAARVHARWPEIAELSAELIARWPDRARGVQAIDLSDGVRLVLAIDAVEPALAGLEIKADAWFLDGFAPSRNPDMWSGPVLQRLAELSAPDALAGTYTVAGAVRRGLEAAGFEVARREGHGGKKERLEARLRAGALARAAASGPRHVVVVGAGVAGCWATRAYLDRGCRVTLVDQALRVADGASGNPLALVMPRLDATDTAEARALIAAFLHARRAWSGLGADAVQALDVRRLPGTTAEPRRFQKLADDPPLEPTLLAPLDPMHPDAGLRLGGCLAIRPDIALPRLASNADFRGGAQAVRIEAHDAGVRLWLAGGEAIEADEAVIALGAGADGLAGAQLPPIERRLGQIESADWTRAPFASADGGYVVAAMGRMVVGATFGPADEGPLLISEGARTENLEVLARLHPEVGSEAMLFVSRAGVRATTRDRLPYAGLAPGQSRVRLLGGFGARGFLWAPLLADSLAADAFGEPSPMEAQVRARLLAGRLMAKA